MNEVKIRDNFINSGCLRGKWAVEVSLFDFSKDDLDKWFLRADATCLTEEGDLWILEVKQKLNHHALGQLLTYSYFLKQLDIPHKLGVVCQKIEPSERKMVKVFEKYKIRVWP